jgi:SecD/SecF fusion protein
VPRMPRAAFSQIVNRSMSEVLTRSLATSFCTLLPVLALLLFGGETLKNFAFALMVGIASGAYSSIFIASPVLTHWKEREGSYRNRRARLVRDFGLVPPYATALDGSPIDVEPAKQRRRQRKGGLLVAAEEPGEQVSQEEFEEMVRDLDIEREDGNPAQPPTGPRGGRGAAVAGARGNGRRGRGGRTSNLTGPSAGTGTMPARTRVPKAPSAPVPKPEPEEGRAGTSSPPQDPAADLTPEDLVLKEQPKRPKRPRNKRHGRSR